MVWLPRPALPETAHERQTPTPKPSIAPRHHVDLTPALTSLAPPSDEEDNSAHPPPDWTEELHLAAKSAVAQEFAKKRHELDFAHVYPKAPTKAQQIAWDYAATHRVESLPQGGILIHLSDNCVLALIPLPLVACAIGKSPANGVLFEHLQN